MNNPPSTVVRSAQTGKRTVFTKKTRPSYTVFIGGAGDKESFIKLPLIKIFGPTYIMKMVEEKFQEKTKLPDNAAEYFGYEEADRNVVEKKIIERRDQNPGVLIQIVGHSYGADSAVGIASRIGSQYNIDLLITLDPVGYRNRLVKTESRRADDYPQKEEIIRLPRPGGIAFWVNIWAHPPSANWSDIVAKAGGQWQDEIRTLVDVFYELPVNHLSAEFMLESIDPTGDLKRVFRKTTPWDVLIGNAT
jgi:pimeloyl-ACP methyl ester carboxylesterase